MTKRNYIPNLAMQNLFFLSAAICLPIITLVIVLKNFSVLRPYRRGRRRRYHDDEDRFRIWKRIEAIEQTQLEIQIEIFKCFLLPTPLSNDIYNEIKNKIESLQEQLNETKD